MLLFRNKLIVPYYLVLLYYKQHIIVSRLWLVSISFDTYVFMYTLIAKLNDYNISLIVSLFVIYKI